MPIKFLPALNGNPEWGDIAGSIEFQSDLAVILSAKSPVIHNHNLNDLSEKSYNSLDDLPELENFSKISGNSELVPCYILNGVSDFIAVPHSVSLDVNSNFSIILRFSAIHFEDFAVIASKGIKSSNKGWTLYSAMGTVGFSIGDGTKYFTASHSVNITEGKIYQLAITYNHSERKLLFGVDNTVEEFDFTSLNLPAYSPDPLVIGKNPANDNFSAIGIHSLIILNKSLTSVQIIKLFNNGKFTFNSVITTSENLMLCLLPESFGKYFWYDCSGAGHHATIHGEMMPNFRTDVVVIPVNMIIGDIEYTDAVPEGYSIEYISFYNHSLNDISVTFLCGTVELISAQNISSDTERVFSIHFLPSVYETGSFTVEFDGTNFECDVVIILRKQIPTLK